MKHKTNKLTLLLIFILLFLPAPLKEVVLVDYRLVKAMVKDVFQTDLLDIKK